MTLESFKEKPWFNSHSAYKDSALAMSPAPEYASSEVILASLFRHIGFPDSPEGTVPLRGRDLDKQMQKYRDKGRKPDDSTLDADSFHMLLHATLESPKLPNQSSKRFVQITPLVPQTATFSGSARLSSNSWPAGSLVRKMIWLGTESEEGALAIWQELFDALTVSDGDDVFARFIQSEIEAWTPEAIWGLVPLQGKVATDLDDLRGLSYPAKRFVRDLRAVILAKDNMTRRQWISLIEAIIRLGVVSHVVWLCDVHDGMWRSVREALNGHVPSSIEEVRMQIFPKDFRYLSYGDKALPEIRDRVSKFLTARLGLNATLWACEAIGKKTQALSSARSIFEFCGDLRDCASEMAEMQIRETLSEIIEGETRALLCKKGIGSNIMEFARHALGQRQTANQVLRGYDQGYFLHKRGTSNASPWVVGLGPVAILALVHCALSETKGPRSVHRFSQHLAAYGLTLDHRDIATSNIGHQLRMLGLVLDSPDAESGMLLVPPFNQIVKNEA